MTGQVGPRGLSVLIVTGLLGLAVCLTGCENQRLVLGN